MPIVTDTSAMGSAQFIVRTLAGSETTVTVPSGTQRSQKGYRSGRLLGVDHDAYVASMGSNWGASYRNLRILNDYVETLERPNRTNRVNSRDFTMFQTEPSAISMSAEVRATGLGPWSKASSTGYFGFTQIPGSTAFPAWPKVAERESIAGAGIRRAAPTTPEMNLARSIGELRDAPQLLKASAYVPLIDSTGRNPISLRKLNPIDAIGTTASSFLHYIFGVAPTVSDIGKALETVERAVPIVTEFIAQERQKMRRTASRVLFEDTGHRTVLTNSQPNYIQYNGTFLRIDGSRPAWGSPLIEDMRPKFELFVSRRTVIRSFATYEYFIPQPIGLSGRLSNYQAQARRLLGSGLTPETAWELTPFSWLADWFVDIGGLLRYQQSVKDDGLVATRSGYTISNELRASASYSVAIMRDVPSRSRNLSFEGKPAIMLYRKEERRRGSPYNMAPTWGLTPMQGAIVTAVGLTNAPLP